MTWGNSTAKGFAELLDLIPVAALESPRLWILPLADSRRQPTEILQKLRDSLSLGLVDATVLAFEHPVRIREGRGKPSYTDLTVHCPGTCRHQSQERGSTQRRDYRVAWGAHRFGGTSTYPSPGAGRTSPSPIPRFFLRTSSKAPQAASVTRMTCSYPFLWSSK